MSDFDTKGLGADNELQEFLMVEKQKAQVNAQVSIIHVGFRLFEQHNP